MASARSALACAVAVVAVVASGCGAGALYEACNGATDCQEGLRCVDLGNDQRVCTRPCSVTKERAGYPEGLDGDDLFTDGAGANAKVDDPICADAAIAVTSQDDPDQAAQNIAIESEGVVGVCRVAPELLADDNIAAKSVLRGFCAPL
jgi:hypothetical protein